MAESRRSRRPSAADLAAAAFYALPFSLVTLTVRYGPSTVDPCASPLLLEHALPAAALGLVLGLALGLAVLWATDIGGFILRASAACAAAITVSVVFGSVVHRDYFTAVFQYILTSLALFLYWFRSRPASEVRYGTFRAIGRAGYALFFLLAFWIMLMGYAISTRAEPRPIESVIYNSYNSVMAVIFLVASRELVLRSYRTLSLRGDGTVLLDGAGIDFVLGAAGIRILRAFLRSADRRATCADIGREAFEDGRGKRRSDCASCDAEGVKASLCPEYRATYNRVLELKKLLEFLEVGSILPPQNKRKILSEGWKLVPFENVRLEAEEGEKR